MANRSSGTIYTVLRFSSDKSLPNQTFMLKLGKNIVGRSYDSSVFVPSDLTSRRHCCITVCSGWVELEDIKSSNGTFLNDVKLSDKRVIVEDDFIGVGSPIQNHGTVLQLKRLRTTEAIDLDSDSDSDTIKREPESEQNGRSPTNIDTNDVVVIDDDDESLDLDNLPEYSAPGEQRRFKVEAQNGCLPHSPENASQSPERSAQIIVKSEPQDCTESVPVCKTEPNNNAASRIIDYYEDLTNDEDERQEYEDMEAYLNQFNADPWQTVQTKSESAESSGRRPKSPPIMLRKQPTAVNDDDDDDDVQFIDITTDTYQILDSPSQNEDEAIVVDDDDDGDDNDIDSAAAAAFERSLFPPSPPQSKPLDEDRSMLSWLDKLSYTADAGFRGSSQHDQPETKRPRLDECSVLLHPIDGPPSSPESRSDDEPDTENTLSASEGQTSEGSPGDRLPLASISAPNAQQSAEAPQADEPLPKDPEARLSAFLLRRKSVSGPRVQIIEPHAVGRRKRTRRSSIAADPNERHADAPADVDSDRRARLRDIAEAQKKRTEPVSRVATTPKVKVTMNNRGAFLADSLCVPPKPPLPKQQAAKAKKSAPRKARAPVAAAPVAKAPSSETPAIPSDEPMQDAVNWPPVDGPANVPPSVPFVLPASVDEAELQRELATFDVRVAPPDHPLTSVLVRRRLPLHSHESAKRVRFDLNRNQVLMIDARQSTDCVETAPLVLVETKSDRKMRAITAAVVVDPLSAVIDHITSWAPGWLNLADADRAPVNGTDTPMMPLQLTYNHMQSYISLYLPLMKLELWNSLHRANLSMRSTSKCPIKVHDAVKVPRGTNDTKYTFNCIVNAANIWLTLRDLVVVSFTHKESVFSFFGIVTMQSTCQTTAAMSVQIETCNLLAASLTVRQDAFLQKLHNINIDLNTIQAVLQLDKSPLCERILDPTNFPISQMANLHQMPYEYGGFEKLNAEQEQIVRQICYRWEKRSGNITLVDGPPGTGKSRLIVNLIGHFVKGVMPNRPLRVLFCAHSNAAVDVICRRLMKMREKYYQRRFSLVRFGHPERMHPECHQVSMEALAKNIKSIPELQRDLEKVRTKLMAKRILTGGDRLKINRSIDSLQRTEQVLQQAIGKTLHDASPNDRKRAQFVMSTANVICTTLHGCVFLSKYLSEVDICIVDEATQCPEPSTLLPLQLGPRSLVLVGDTMQLHGTVLSRHASKLGLIRSLFHRTQEAFAGRNKELCTMFRLHRQYRMHPDIVSWPNSYFYENRLTTADRSQDEQTRRFPLRPYSIIGLRSRHTEQLEPQHQISNVDEAQFIVQLLTCLGPNINGKYSIGVIAPYQKQRDDLVNGLKPLGLKYLLVDTIDSYQGQERDIIIVSCTRSRGIGFLDNEQRLNVALTRARQCLIVCGNFSSLGQNAMWKSLLKNADQRKCYRNINYGNDVNAQIVRHLVKSDHQSDFKLS